MNDKSYINLISMTDKSLLELIGKFVKHHRVNQNKSQEQVSLDANISRSTLSLLERGESVNLNSFIKTLRGLYFLYVLDVFKVQDTISPIEYAKLKRKQRERAGRSKQSNSTEDSEW